MALAMTAGSPSSESAPSSSGLTPRRWPDRMPIFLLPRGIVREVTSADAPALAATMADPDVRRSVNAPMLAVDDVSRFIRWAREERRHERLASFVIVPHDTGTAGGIFQMWSVGPASGVMEIGFALERRLWGTGLFTTCASALIDFAIDRMGIHRIEARASVRNTRTCRALSKLGAVREGVLRQSVRSDEENTDCEMWSILADEWQDRRHLKPGFAP